jgi:uncharacterized membrane protein YvlD (DUF360 family)
MFQRLLTAMLTALLILVVSSFIHTPTNAGFVGVIFTALIFGAILAHDFEEK